jgi:hypothetical protein
MEITVNGCNYNVDPQALSESSIYFREYLQRQRRVSITIRHPRLEIRNEHISMALRCLQGDPLPPTDNGILDYLFSYWGAARLLEELRSRSSPRGLSKRNLDDLRRHARYYNRSKLM